MIYTDKDFQYFFLTSNHGYFFNIFLASNYGTIDIFYYWYDIHTDIDFPYFFLTSNQNLVIKFNTG